MLGGSGGLARLIFQAQIELSSQRPRAVSMCRQSPSMHSVQGRGSGEGGSRHCGRVVYRWVQDGGSSALLGYGHIYPIYIAHLIMCVMIYSSCRRQCQVPNSMMRNKWRRVSSGAAPSVSVRAVGSRERRCMSCFGSSNLRLFKSSSKIN
jgi:hypothetical protein